MLLLHQAGSVKIGEVVRYTVTYTPANDRILPSPSHLHLKIKNTSAIALRAAFIHGPYTLYVASSPSNFKPNEKFMNPRRDGVPEFEPNLKAGGTWYSQLSIPEDVRDTAGSAQSHTQVHTGNEIHAKSVTWIIEVASQVIFSNSVSVHYEILLGRDEKSLSMGFGGLSPNSPGGGLPGQISDHQQSRGAKDGHHKANARGVYSRAITVKVDDTASLWNTPKLPDWDNQGQESGQEKNKDAPVDAVESSKEDTSEVNPPQTRKKVHLVVLTHGLHSNLGADMLYLKESIDVAAKKAKEDAKIRRSKRREDEKAKASNMAQNKDDLHQEERKTESGETKPPAEQIEDNTDEIEDDEEVIVRGFSGNAVRTEKGIKYLGKRLAKYVLAMTYPDQPFRPITKAAHGFAASLRPESSKSEESGRASHMHSTIHEDPYREKKPAYQITSISFIAHSLGGLIQTYAVAYIQKHSPHFFDLIKPINFIAMATPFLGLSNENPIYVKFALDFGLVGRTGQDLGLTWRAPTLARSGWGAIVSGISESTQKRAEGERDPGTKPLLRILPTGPAHIALKKFRNRTVYSNVVNDGIVPLRTSCLLFLDWQGLGRVEKARRENGLVGTMAGWGWAELTGANATAAAKRQWMDGYESEHDDSEIHTPNLPGDGAEVPQPGADATEDDARSLKTVRTTEDPSNSDDPDATLGHISPTAETANNSGPLDSILGLFRSHPSPKSHKHVPKSFKIYKRSQTMNSNDDSLRRKATEPEQRGKATSGEQFEGSNIMSAPPRTSFFESAGDVLNPPLPPISFLVDPESRPRTIFHDRVYHPEDIPPPPIKHRSTSFLSRRSSSSPSRSAKTDSFGSDDTGSTHTNSVDLTDGGPMKVEEKIARAYHRDLSWRKVLVRLEPDAHNNMIVRRQFANAYGWPVVKHLVDTHFSDLAVAKLRDEDETSEERAKNSDEKPSRTGDEIKSSQHGHVREHPHQAGEERLEEPHFTPQHHRTDSEQRESADSVPPLNSMKPGSLAQALNSSSGKRPSVSDRKDSAQWSDRDFMDSEDDSDAEPTSTEHKKTPSGTGWSWTEAIAGKGPNSPKLEKGTSKKDIDEFLQKRPQSGSAGLDAQKRSANEREAAKIIHGDTSAVGLKPVINPEQGELGSVSEQVARVTLGAGPANSK